jgi:RecB family exonuclease
MPGRVFIDWSLPFLPEVARYVIGARGDDARREIDLSRVLMVTPGSRAGRILLYELIAAAEARGRPLVPPRIITPGGLAEVLADGRFALASAREVAFAWWAAVREANDDIVAALAPDIRATDFSLQSFKLAAMLSALDGEIRGEGLEYEAIVDLVDELAGPREADRWRAIARLKVASAARLAEAGLMDPNDALGRLREMTPPAQIEEALLVGVTEAPAAHAGVFRAWESRGWRVNAFVQAPENMAGDFDDFGCPIEERWRDQQVQIDDDDILVADRPGDQAQCVLSAVAATSGALPPESIAIGLGDETIGPALKRAARRAGLDIHLAAGESIVRETPLTFLSCAANWLLERRFANLAALARHVDFERHCLHSGDMAAPLRDEVAELDRAFRERLPHRLAADAWPDDNGATAPFQRIQSAADSLLRNFEGPPRSCGEWMPAILELLGNVYGNLIVDDAREPVRKLADCCTPVAEVCAQLTALPPVLQHECAGADAIRFLVAQCSSLALAEHVRAGQIEALGWLELRFDPAEWIIITGFNDGLIPSRRAEDGLLPDSVRARLGLSNNRWRAARDLYVFEAIRQPRRRTIVITGRRDALGQPLLPSRLLLAGEARDLPRRVLGLTSGRGARAHGRQVGWPPPAPSSRFVVAEAPPGPCDLPRMRVTQFRRYLECPFRFWLECIRTLVEAGDDADELDPLHFGSLAHEVLRDFGRDASMRESTDAAAIARDLASRLRAAVRSRFGATPMAGVRVQESRLRQRLQAFSLLQAGLRKQGWRIHGCEVPLPEANCLEMDDGPPMPVSGVIDRIDMHDELGTRLIDYKTSESGESPRAAHGPKRDGTWLDLQLPLYHHFYCRWREEPGNPQAVRLAYIALPKKPGQVALLEADWTTDELLAAVARAREIVASIRAGKFPRTANPPLRDPFANICQTTAYAAALLEDSEDAD